MQRFFGLKPVHHIFDRDLDSSASPAESVDDLVSCAAAPGGPDEICRSKQHSEGRLAGDSQSRCTWLYGWCAPQRGDRRLRGDSPVPKQARCGRSPFAPIDAAPETGALRVISSTLQSHMPTAVRDGFKKKACAASRGRLDAAALSGIQSSVN